MAIKFTGLSFPSIASDAANISERIRAQTEEANIKSETTEIRYPVSIGLQPTRFERWLNAADSLLYRAKLEGRNRVVQATAVAA